ISQFREKFNADNPKLPLNEFRSIATSRDRANLTRAASKINENLYASTALERGTLKIKSMQISQFREKFNADNPKLPLNEFRSIATSRDRANLT
ncbi:DUF1454 family protein, partial [Enterobacter hormaechei]|uniref:DUF1454 family protein n=1 Tax=Enterobacter hormaechei TaxID=158836 RepID=UPI00197AFE17